MVAGQTGAGKTTFVDCFVNWLLKVELYDTIRYKLVDESSRIAEQNEGQGASLKQKEEQAQLSSMTSEVTIYHIPSGEIKQQICAEGICCVNIIDTPGFGDTRGPQWD